SLKPGDGILVGNVAHLILAEAAADLAAGRIDFAALRHVADWGDLHYLYADAAGREALVKRARGHAEVARARSHFDRALILAPNNASLYFRYEGLLDFLNEPQGLTNLARRAAESRVDLAALRQDRLDFWQGKRDAKWRPETAAAAARAERTVGDARKAGGATF